MTILDDAREGMNPDIRPQDDLFGHVNGTWLDTVEIPADRSSWGPFVTLADQAEQHVRAIIEECAASTGSSAAEPGSPCTTTSTSTSGRRSGSRIAPARSPSTE